MREKNTDPSSRNVPHCPLSEQCVYFMNELEWRQEEYDQPGLSMIREKGLDQGLIAQLRFHARNCAVCTRALEEARAACNAQRSELRYLLEEEEHHMPSTSEHILKMIDEGQWNNGVIQQTPIPAGSSSLSHPSSWRPRAYGRHVLQSIYSLMAVGIFILTSSGLFGYLASLHTTFVSKASVVAGPVSGWTSAILTITQIGNVSIHVLDPVSGKSALLASSRFLQGTSTESVSHDGTKLLYYVYDGKKTDYYLQPSAQGAVLYTFQGKGGHAIWSTGDHYVFVSTVHGVEQVDTQNRSARLILPGLKYPDLRFYHSGYLYYVSNRGGGEVLNRINTSSDAAQEVTNCLRGSSFWLNPTGQTIYYMCRGQRTLFAVNTDGTNARLMRSDNGTMIGYADDNTPLLLSKTHGRYQIVKPGGDKQQDQVLLDDVAPGASLIPANNVAVAPYGHALVTKAMYPDHHEEIWYGDLNNGEKHLLLTPGKNMQVQLGGWSRMHVAGAPEVQVNPTQNFSDWHNVLMTGSNAAGWLGIYNVNAQDGSGTLLESNKLPSQTHIDGVAPDGLHMLYHYADRGKTGYYVLTQTSRSKTFYMLVDSEAGNAVWMPDSRHVLIATTHNGVLMVDSTNGASTSLLAHINNVQLTFYRYPYLYFVAMASLQEGALYRVNVADQSVQQVTMRSSESTFWLSPNGFTIYYVNRGSDGGSGIYAVDGDSTHQRLVSKDGVPIGYADNDDLVIMRQHGNKFQVVQVVETSNTMARNLVLLDDALPGAVALCDQGSESSVGPICDGSVALAPLGKSLLAEASYGDGSRRVWSIDLRSGKRVQVSSILTQPHTHVDLVGWDRLSSGI